MKNLNLKEIALDAIVVAVLSFIVGVMGILIHQLFTNPLSF